MASLIDPATDKRFDGRTILADARAAELKTVCQHVVAQLILLDVVGRWMDGADINISCVCMHLR
jgi:hypothetical protein